jgi:hypothetical protein
MNIRKDKSSKPIKSDKVLTGNKVRLIVKEEAGLWWQNYQTPLRAIIRDEVNK